MTVCVCVCVCVCLLDEMAALVNLIIPNIIKAVRETMADTITPTRMGVVSTLS